MHARTDRYRAQIIALIEQREEREAREEARQIAYWQRRRAEIARTMADDAMRAAYREMTATHPQWPAPLCRPVRSNQPKAGDAGYEPYSPAPERTKLALCVLLVCGAVLVGLIIAGLRWRAGAAW